MEMVVPCPIFLINYTTDGNTAYWPQVWWLILYVIFDFTLVSMWEYNEHAVQNWYNAEIKINILTNLLDQEQDYINSERHGFPHWERIRTTDQK